MKRSTTRMHGLAAGSAALLIAAVIAFVALRHWLAPQSAVALVELFSFCQ